MTTIQFRSEAAAKSFVAANPSASAPEPDDEWAPHVWCIEVDDELFDALCQSGRIGQ